jgi:acetoin utilization protein AcuB
MSAPVVTADASDHVADAARIMLEDKVGSLPVLEGGRLVGIITETDLLREICRADASCSPEVTDIVVSYP